MRLCMVGAGMVGGTLARLWSRAGHQVVLTSRHPEELQELAGELGGQAAGLPAGLEGCDAVLLAVPLGAVPDVARTCGAQLAGQVVMDACNPFPRRDGPAGEAAKNTPGGSGIWTARQLPQARVVKAFNTVFYRTLQTCAHRPEPRVAVPLAGDCEQALAVVEQLVQDAGFDPVTVGGLASSASFDPTSSVWNTGWDAARVLAELSRQQPDSRISSVG